MGPSDPLHTDHRPRDGLSALFENRGIPAKEGVVRSLFKAATDEQGNPVQNSVSDLRVTATSPTTALTTAFLAERIALFSIVMAVALLLTGIWFLVLTIAVLRPERATEPTPPAA